MSKKRRTITNYEALAQSVNVAYNAALKASIQAAHVTPLSSKPARDLNRVYEMLNQIKSDLEAEMYRHVPAEDLAAAGYGEAGRQGPLDAEWMISPFYPGQKAARFPHLAAALGELEAIEAERLEAEHRANLGERATPISGRNEGQNE